MQNFQWLIKNKVEFPRETKKNSCEMSRGLVFLVFKFSWDIIYIILPNFHGLSFVLPGIYRGREKNKNIPGFFSKKVCPQSLVPCLFFVFFPRIAHSKTIDLNWSYKALARIEALTLCQDRAFASFSYFLSLLSVLERFTHLYCDTDSLGRGAPPCMGSKAPTTPCTYIIEDRRKPTALQHLISRF